MKITEGKCPVSCNFDDGLCIGWSQSKSDVFDWTLRSGSTPSSDTGPSSDHGGSGLLPAILRKFLKRFFDGKLKNLISMYNPPCRDIEHFLSPEMKLTENSGKPHLEDKRTRLMKILYLVLMENPFKFMIILK